MKYTSHALGAAVYPDANLIPFYGGIFSQWTDCKFTTHLLPNITLSSAEQGMMLLKAKLFEDDEAFDLILASTNPKDQKAIGRTIKNFDAERWNEVALDYVSELNYEKFNQNYAWRELLKLTYPLELVEASPYDKIWGIGMGEDNPDICDRSKWDGENLLGIAIMNARDKILGV